MIELILILNLTATFMLCGLIWTVQLVHYPSFHFFEKADFETHMTSHKFRISLIVVPLMLMELITSAILGFYADSLIFLHQVGFVIVVAIWLITFLVQVPLHNSISSGYREDSVTKLVRTNSVRTVLWSLKSLLGIYILWVLI